MEPMRAIISADVRRRANRRYFDSKCRQVALGPGAGEGQWGAQTGRPFHATQAALYFPSFPTLLRSLACASLIIV